MRLLLPTYLSHSYLFSCSIPFHLLKTVLLMHRFIGNLDLCGRQVNRPCRTSMGFPVVLPHAESDEAAGKFLGLSIFSWVFVGWWIVLLYLVSSSCKVTFDQFAFGKVLILYSLLVFCSPFQAIFSLCKRSAYWCNVHIVSCAGCAACYALGLDAIKEGKSS